MSEFIEKALRCLGRGFDVTCDFRAKFCKGRERLVVINEDEKRELVVPGFGSVSDVSVDVNSDKGDRIRYQSDVLDFNQMSEVFNKRSSIGGKIPSGFFNSMFDFNGSTWARDAYETKYLAMDAYFISLFNLHIDRRPLTLSSHIIESVPTMWDPSALARFIAKYGTHIIVGVSMGGKDAIYVRQDQSSNLTASEIKQHLHELGDQLFTGACTILPPRLRSKDDKLKVHEAFNIFDPQPFLVDGFTTVSSKKGVTVISLKRGGNAMARSHCEWLLTVPSMPDVINFTFMPITSLLKGVRGTGFLTHAINLYLRYKPPISELEYFLDFQSHRVWAPLLNEHPLGPNSNISIQVPALQFNHMGPKLYINTSQVNVGQMPVTGLRLHLEGKKNDRLAVHLQHLSDAPKFINIVKGSSSNLLWQGLDTTTNEKFFEPIKRKRFGRVCTMPVKYNPQWSKKNGTSAFIVTGAQLYVMPYASTQVLQLRLLFSEIPNCMVSQSKWERGGKSNISQKMSFLSFSNNSAEREMEKQQQRPAIVVDSGVFPTGPPVPVHAQKMLKYVDTTEIRKGPQDCPGYWLVTGAKLDSQKGRIGIHVKFSLLTSLS